LAAAGSYGHFRIVYFFVKNRLESANGYLECLALTPLLFLLLDCGAFSAAFVFARPAKKLKRR
jgi:hypothetical protein